jgi:hypothetical protein
MGDRTAAPRPGHRAVKSAHPSRVSGVYEMKDATSRKRRCRHPLPRPSHAVPVLVYARDGDLCRISARCPPGSTTELGPLVRELAAACGGSGGGHNLRAGATIPCDNRGVCKRLAGGGRIMMQIEGTITTLHREMLRCVAAALAPDNLRSMDHNGRRRPGQTTITGHSSGRSLHPWTII